MKNKIYYLSRSYYPYQNGGGPMMRRAAVQYLQELGWEVIVVMPNYHSKELIKENNILQIPFNDKYIPKIASLLERVGIYEDYLDKWVENAFNHLKYIVTEEDIVFSTCGGELSMIKLGSLLKQKVHCKSVVNFRDPLNYAYMNGLKHDNRFHVNREKAQKKYLASADAIVTSSKYYADVLKNRFIHLEDRIYNNYFGYIKQVNASKYIKKVSSKLRIACSGSMLSNVQKPELLYEAFKMLSDKNNVEIYFIGNTDMNKSLRKIKSKNIKFIEFLPHNDFLEFMCENIDVGFVSLAKDYYGACVPSKLYEYINLELPIIAALPYGDAYDIINNEGYGISVNYNNISGLAKAIEILQDDKVLSRFKDNIIWSKEKWAMHEKIKEVDYLLQRIGES